MINNDKFDFAFKFTKTILNIYIINNFYMLVLLFVSEKYCPFFENYFLITFLVYIYTSSGHIILKIEHMP